MLAEVFAITPMTAYLLLFLCYVLVLLGLVRTAVAICDWRLRRRVYARAAALRPRVASTELWAGSEH